MIIIKNKDLLRYIDNNLKEIWLPITDICLNNIIPNYMISNYGRIYSINSNMILKNAEDKDGYYLVSLYKKDGTHSTKRVHRLVMLTFNYIENNRNLLVNHMDGNKKNNRTDNLQWCTSKENHDHAIFYGLKHYSDISGELNPSCIITENQADQIAYLISLQKYSLVEISNRLNVSIGIVESISNGQSWKKYYEKYNICKRVSRLFSNDQLHGICKYFQDHKNDNLKQKQLFINALNSINVEYKESNKETMKRILHKTRFHSITSEYDY